MAEQGNFDWFDVVFKRMIKVASSLEDEEERDKCFFEFSRFLLDLPCSEQQKYIQRFVTAYDSQ